MFLGEEVHYYMVYITYFTDQICDYAQKRRICPENCKYWLDENFGDHPDKKRHFDSHFIDFWTISLRSIIPPQTPGDLLRLLSTLLLGQVGSPLSFFHYESNQKPKNQNK